MRAARRRVPKMFFDYADSGSYTEQTYRENTTDFQKITLRQKVAVNLENRNLASTMMGQKVSMPVAIAPVGSTGMQSANGEIKAARAAEQFGIPFTLSTMSICSIEQVAEGTSKPFWFQLYVMRDRDFIVGGQGMKVQRAVHHKFGQAAGIALLLPRQATGAQRIEIARQQRFGCAAHAQFRLQLAPDRRGGGDADLLADDGAQQRLIARLAHARYRVADAGDRRAECRLRRSDEVQADAQFFRRAYHVRPSSP